MIAGLDRTFHIETVEVPDPDIWPTDYNKTVTRYSLVDEKGVVWLGGHQFGFLRDMCVADRTSRDCRYLLRKTHEDADRDRYPMPIDSYGDAYEQCYWLFEWERTEELIAAFGIAPVIEAFFDRSGSAALHDSGHTETWIAQAIDVFGDALLKPSWEWFMRPNPKHIPTSYLEDDLESQGNKAEYIANTKRTARMIHKRLSGW